jgi:hypothetical protein
MVLLFDYFNQVDNIGKVTEKSIFGRSGRVVYFRQAKTGPSGFLKLVSLKRIHKKVIE